MKYIIIGNGELEDNNYLKNLIKSSEIIIAADGGAKHLRRINLLPHVIIGDFDSIDPEDKIFFEKKKIRTIRFPSKKDHTDTELCISWALANGATDITLLGATGSRLDHTLANIFLLKRLAGLNIPGRIIDKNNEIHIVKDYLEIKGNPGEFLSIIPLDEKAAGINLKGLEYPLSNGAIPMGSSLGISNSFNEKTACISVKKGFLIVTKSRD